MICRTIHLTGFYMIWIFTESYFLNRLQKGHKWSWRISNTMTSLFYYKYSASIFLNRSGFKVPSQILMKKSSGSFFSTFFRCYHFWSRYYHSWLVKYKSNRCDIVMVREIVKLILKRCCSVFERLSRSLLRPNTTFFSS